eukprot:CAMPEP_0118645068 /NCGR_PEP_ID=MMETSP0785-20121206/7296_1 /TAXON_ID=91992 /ORGANISM="Bolidomonas pacifica, Strain CCMP 1866" /LENGTH=425 /DNA_ID=CAMNT_0006536911 /DNA_START=64 /DNA_END=1338 /DNA_ORIENTATION=-
MAKTDPEGEVGIDHVAQFQMDAKEVEHLTNLKSNIKANIESMSNEKNKIYGEIMIKEQANGVTGTNIGGGQTAGTAPAGPVVPNAPAPVLPPPSPKNGSGQSVYYASSPDNPMLNVQPSIVHFPCPLRDDPDPEKCRLECEDAECSRAERICSNYIECTHIVYDGEHGDDLKGKFVTLMHEVKEENLGGSESAFEKWGTKLTKAEKPRTYVIISYGGSGSKMLSGWISDLPKSSVVDVKHMHDPNPPDVLREFNRPLREATHQGDYRNRHIPGGMFPRDTKLINEGNYDDFRYIYIFKDPVEGLVSRYGHGHCLHVGGDCGNEQGFPSLEQYAKGGKDFFKITDFFEHWTTEGYGGRTYPVIAVNYHKIWDNVPAVVEALGLPQKHASSFPKRTETVRNNKTGAKEGHMNHSEEARNGLRGIYKG